VLDLAEAVRGLDAPERPAEAGGAVTMGARLDRLDDIDWGRLTHAYGRADDVPEYIRALLSPDAAARRKALGGLHATICHQGSR
jgi:hypothetical protein